MNAKIIKTNIILKASLLFLLLFPAGSLFAATYVNMPVSGGTPVELFQFSTVAGMPPTNSKIAAKFVVNDTSSDLIFQLAPVPPHTKFDPESFATGGAFGGTQSLTHKDTDETAFQLRARDLSDPTTNPTPETAATDHRIISLMIEIPNTYSFPSDIPTLTWSVRAVPISSPLSYSGFWDKGDGPDANTVKDTLLANVTRAKLLVDPDTLDFGEVQIFLPIDETPLRPYTLKNVGTDSLIPSGGLSPPSSSAFAIEGAPVIQPLMPMESLAESISIRFRPTGLGDSGVTPGNRVVMNIGSNDPDTPPSLTMQGTGVTIDAVMLMDLSGSMNRSAETGAQDAPELDARLWKAKEASLQLYQAYRELTGGRARVGVYGFPDPLNPPYCDWDGSNCDPPTYTKPVPINDAELVLGQVTTAFGRISVGGLTAAGGTPMAKGIDVTQRDLQTEPGKCPAILLLSDGAHNVPSDDPQEVLNWIPNLQSKGIRVYSVAYGDPDLLNTEVDHGTLNQLSTDTGGLPLAANPTDYEELKLSFRNALREWLGMRDVEDPTGSISSTQSKSHEVCLDDEAYMAMFVVDWNDERDEAISVEIETPLGERLTSSSPGVAFYKSKSYAMYVVKGAHIRGGAGAGLWRLHLTGSSSLPGTLNYHYSVLAQSPINPTPTFNENYYFAGDQLFMEFNLSERVRELIGPQDPVIKVEIDAPAESFGTFLARSKIKPEWVFGQHKATNENGIIGTAHAQQTVSHARKTEPMGLAQRKVEALKKYADITFPRKREKQTLEFIDNGKSGDRVAGDGIYTAALSSLPYDGMYDFHYTFTTEPTRRGCVNMNTHVAKYVAFGFDTALKNATVDWIAVNEKLFFDPSMYKKLKYDIDPRPGIERMAVKFTPKDGTGNLLSPGQASQLKFSVKNGETIGGPIDNWDGSYIQIVEFKKGDTPSVTVAARGFTSPEIPMEKPFKIPLYVWILLILALIAIVVILILRKPTSP